MHTKFGLDKHKGKYQLENLGINK